MVRKNVLINDSNKCTTITFFMFLITEYFWVSIKLSSITRIAILTSSSCTYSRKCIRACASAIRIIDSICRTVIGILPVIWQKRHVCSYFLEQQLRLKRQNVMQNLQLNLKIEHLSTSIFQFFFIHLKLHKFTITETT